MLAIGLVVDDAIVVLENIVRRIEHGEPPLLAAMNGSREIGFAVIATTMVLVAVFLPISYLQGNVGRLFSEFGITVAAAVVFSAHRGADADADDDFQAVCQGHQSRPPCRSPSTVRSGRVAATYNAALRWTLSGRAPGAGAVRSPVAPRRWRSCCWWWAGPGPECACRRNSRPPRTAAACRCS